MKRFFTLLLLTGFTLSCRTSKPPVIKTTDDGKIEVVFLQLNDVYEITPLEGGKVGGLARVATLRDQLKAQNFNTITVLAGDFLNPSVIGTLKHEGSRIAGRQMVEVLNALGLDLATFGNHEFDLSETDLLKRMQESKFGWVSANVGHKTPTGVIPFTSGPDLSSVTPTWIYNFVDEDGTRLKLGVIGVTLPSNQAPYVHYGDFYQAAASTYAALQAGSDVVVGLTHLAIDEDKELLRRVPGIKLIMGGHEHDHRYLQVGDSYIAKADANAKTAYVHRLQFDKNTKKLTVASQPVNIDSTFAFQPQTQAMVQKWTDIAARSFQELGFDPNTILMTATTPLDGRESSIRHGSTNLTELIIKAVSAAAPDAELSILNSGAIRIDDQLSGPVTQYDIIRTLPYGGKIVEVEMKGELLEKVLTIGRDQNAGEGGFLQLDRATYDSARKQWLIGEKPLNRQQMYRVAMPGFLITGGEKNLEFLKLDSPGIGKVYEPDAQHKSDPRHDIRSAVISYINKK